MWCWKPWRKIKLCPGTGLKLGRLLTGKYWNPTKQHTSLSTFFYTFLSASAKQILVKLPSVNTQSSQGPMRAATPDGRKCWLGQMSECHDAEQAFMCSRGPSPLFIRAGLRGRLRAASGSFRCVPSRRPRPPATFDGWLNAKTQSGDLQGKLWNCQPPFLLRSPVVTDSVGQTDDLTLQCGQLSVKR